MRMPAFAYLNVEWSIRVHQLTFSVYVAHLVPHLPVPNSSFEEQSGKVILLPLVHQS